MTKRLMTVEFGLMHLPAADAADDEMFFTDLAGKVRDWPISDEPMLDHDRVPTLNVARKIDRADFFPAMGAGFSD